MATKWSHLTQVSGLKWITRADELKARSVSPYTGEWIEIAKFELEPDDKTVSPYTGEWIEICYRDTR